MASKQEIKGEDWDRQMEKMRAEFEDRLDKLQNKLNRALEREGRVLQDGEEDLIGRLQGSLDGAKTRVQKGVDSSRDVVREHPLLVVGGALAVGLMLGALLSKSRD